MPRATSLREDFTGLEVSFPEKTRRRFASIIRDTDDIMEAGAAYDVTKVDVSTMT
jgi:hypothetical protein